MSDRVSIETFQNTGQGYWHRGGVAETLRTTPASEYENLVCYAIENHPCDSRVTMTDDGIVQTLNARMGTGGGNVPMVLIPYHCECWAIDSHPMDSRIQVVDVVCPRVADD